KWGMCRSDPARDALWLLRGPRPGPARAIGRLERGDVVLVALCHRDVVPGVEQAGAADRIDGEAQGLPPTRDRLLLEIDRHGRIRRLVDAARERGRLLVRHDRGQ